MADELNRLPAPIASLTPETLNALVPLPQPAGPVGEGRDCIPQGEQDNALTALAGFVRQHSLWRLSESGIAHLLAAVCSNGTLDQDPRRPFTQRDYDRIARSIARHPVGSPSYEVNASLVEILQGDYTSFVGPTARWWLRGFIPREELVMLFGPKASGKSTFGSWLAARVTQMGGTFLHVGVEEPYQRFLARAVLGGAARERILGWKGPLKLPSGVEELRKQVQSHQVDIVYFDSIYSNF